MPRKTNAKSKRGDKGEKGKGKRGKGSSRKGSSSLNLSPLTFPPSARPTVAVVGAGRLGTALALALSSSGYDLRAVVARRVAHARRAAALSKTAHTLALNSAQLERLPPVQLLLITTPDDAVAETAARLAAVSPTSESKRVVLHTSGALSSEVLAPLRERGFRTGSVHPLASVSEPLSGAERLRGAFFCVEGEGAAVSAARRVVRDLGGQSFTVRAENKALYHAAAVMTSGHTVALFDTAARLLARCGLSEKRAREVLLPLLRGTLENLSARTPARALTGTFARADVETVRKHLAALLKDGDGAALMLYALLGDSSLKLAARRGDADAADLKEIALALRDVFAKKGGRG